jgi:hypothetical protein
LSTVDEVPALRVALAVPPRASRRFRVRQVLWAVMHVQLSEPEPGVFVVNRAGVPRLLFSVKTEHEADARARSVAVELGSLGVERFCERYRVPLDFLDATDIPHHRIPQLRPLL